MRERLRRRQPIRPRARPLHSPPSPAKLLLRRDTGGAAHHRGRLPLGPLPPQAPGLTPLLRSAEPPLATRGPACPAAPRLGPAGRAGAEGRAGTTLRSPPLPAGPRPALVEGRPGYGLSDSCAGARASGSVPSIHPLIHLFIYLFISEPVHPRSRGQTGCKAEAQGARGTGFAGVPGGRGGAAVLPALLLAWKSWAKR